MIVGACKCVKFCQTRGAHEPVYRCGEWSHQYNWHYSQHTKIYKQHANVDSLLLIDIGKLFQRRATLGKKEDLNNSFLA